MWLLKGSSRGFLHREVIKKSDKPLGQTGTYRTPSLTHSLTRVPALRTEGQYRVRLNIYSSVCVDGSFLHSCFNVLNYKPFLAFSLGLPANLLSLWGLYQLGRSGGGGCQLVYILNLLLSDLLQLLTLPLWILYLQGEHHWPYGSNACQLVGYVFYVNIYASVIFLCLIALDRCLAIVHPLSSRCVRKVRLAAFSGVVVWTVIFLFCLIGLYPSVFEPQRGLCLEQYPVKCRQTFSISSTLYCFFFVLFTPSLVFHSYTSAKIGVTLRNSPSVSDHECLRIVGTLTVITINFIVIFGPYHMVGGYRFIALLLTEDQCTLERSIYLCYRICYGLTSLNTLLNPLFYIFLYHNARLELQRSLPCLSRSSSTHPGYSTKKKNILLQSC
uniref:Si:dkey-165a24.9 n=1 Tax=Astyanax mexicanus TaxID=7994 RepID=A0A8B9KTP3_ASTMX